MDTHPETIVLDPLPAIRTLLDRCKSYQLVHHIEEHMKDERICSPPFMLLDEPCGPDTLELMKQQGLTFPFICKTRVAHGTNSHEMAIIFSAEGLQAVQPPCVCQSFINHNAVLYKVFVVGDSHAVVERPSLKNFPSGPADRKAIFFNSHNVSKPESSSDLTSRDNVEGVSQPPSDDVISALCRALRESLGASLFGIDIIINNQTGQHAVIDINAFPGYEGVPEFYSDLLNHITSVLQTPPPDITGVLQTPPPDITSVLQTPPPDITSVLQTTPPCAPPASSPTPLPRPAERGCVCECVCVCEREAERGCVCECVCVCEREAEGVKASCPRLGCTSALSPNFQQHCVASLTTKASSQ
ncbi:inositol-tetrakisphosphate 1-kinase isoform X2 [Sardina pilchardus]